MNFWSWLFGTPDPVKARYESRTITFGFRENYELDRQPIPDEYREVLIKAAAEYTEKTIINFVYTEEAPDITLSYRRLRGSKVGWTTSMGDIDIDYRTWTDHRLYSVALHELGHALGRKKHSGRKDSVMYWQPKADRLSIWDIENFNEMYKDIEDE